MPLYVRLPPTSERPADRRPAPGQESPPALRRGDPQAGGAAAHDLDTITASWWVDGSSFKVRELTLFPSDGGTGDFPRGTETLAIPSAPPGALNAVKTHLVELVISDGQLFERKSKARVEALPDGGTISNLTYVVTTSWAVVVENKPCP